jgi:hypothetical protein
MRRAYSPMCRGRLKPCTAHIGPCRR